MANNFKHRNETDQANLPRSGHSLSHKYSFTCACGQLLPIFWDYASPGDKYTLGTGFDLSRALPLLSPASVDLSVIVDYFFVPMDLMDIAFGTRYSAVKDMFTTAIKSYNDVVNLKYEPDVLKSYRVRRGTSFFDSFGCAAFRLFDMLGYSPLDITPRKQTSSVGINSTISWLANHARPTRRSQLAYPFLAYQACYQYFYRDEEYETFDPSAFNVDKYSNGFDGVQENPILYSSQDDALAESSDVFGKYFQLRYANRRSDYFTDLTKSALITNVNLGRSLNALGLNNLGLHDWLSNNHYNPIAVDHDGYYSEDNKSSTVGALFEHLNEEVSLVDSEGLSSILNTAGLRAMFAHEKLLRITNSAKKTYDDQILAHFGVKVPHDVKHQITHFGHDVMKYKVAEVVSTAQTESGVLGEQAGRLYGQSSAGSHSFYAPVHGVVMAIMHVSPEYQYLVPENRINNYSSVADFWRPEYDHLGKQPMFRRELQWNAYDSVGGHTVGYYAGDVVGWQYRYAENKRRFNKVSFAFSAGTYNSYALVASPLHFLYKQQLVENYQTIANFVNGSFAYRNKISPHDTDGIFGASYNGIWQEKNVSEVEDASSIAEIKEFIGQRNADLYDFQYHDESDVAGYAHSVDEWLTSTGLDFRNNPEQIYATDPFILHADIKANKVSFMSKNSLPKMDM